MKHLIHSALILAATLCVAFAEEGHDHKAPIAGPLGGRVVEVDGGGHAEFFVQPDRKVTVAFYGEDMKPVAPAGQVVKAVAEAPAGKSQIAFEKTGEAFVSTTALPEGDGYRIVLQIKSTLDAKTKNFRIDYHTEICDGCKRAEYACTCSDHGAPGGGHAH